MRCKEKTKVKDEKWTGKIRCSRQGTHKQHRTFLRKQGFSWGPSGRYWFYYTSSKKGQVLRRGKING